MSGTLVKQIRQPAGAPGAVKWRVTFQCTAAGTLPDTSIFLFQVVQDSDPKNDTLARVCEIDDFTTYSTGRSASITANTRLYRYDTVTLYFDDVATADGAWKELSTRVNTLVKNYDVVLDSFLTAEDGTVFSYPTVDTSTQEELIATYESTLPLVEEAQAARDVDARECVALQLELNMLRTQLTQAQSDLAIVSPVAGVLVALTASYPALTATIGSAKSAIRVVNNGSAASTPDKTSIETQLVVIESAIATLNADNAALVSQVQTPIATLAGDLQTRVTDLTQQVNAKQQEVNECRTTLAELEAALDTARAQRDAALAAVRAVCPDYTP